jgi:hypothetical protein
MNKIIRAVARRSRVVSLSITTIIVTTMFVFNGSTAFAEPIDPENPQIFVPTGPNFVLFTGAAPGVQLIGGIILVAVFAVGLFLVLRGILKFRLADRDSGRGAQGVGMMLTGVILIAAAFITAPVINTILIIVKALAESI